MFVQRVNEKEGNKDKKSKQNGLTKHLTVSRFRRQCFVPVSRLGVVFSVAKCRGTHTSRS